MAMKWGYIFPNAPASLKPHHPTVYCHIVGIHGVGFYPSAEVQSVYSTAPADWAFLYGLKLGRDRFLMMYSSSSNHTLEMDFVKVLPVKRIEYFFKL